MHNRATALMRDAALPAASRYGTKQIRVLTVIPALTSGGAEWMAAHLTAGLDRRRFTVGLVILNPSTNSAQEALASAGGTETWFLDKRAGFDAQVLSRLQGAIRSFAPDVVHTHLRALCYVLPLLWRKGTPAIHTVHRMLDRPIEIERRIVNHLAFRKRVLPVSVSPQVKESLARQYGVRESPIIPNGIPVKMYRNGKGQRDAWRAREGFRQEDILFTCVARPRPIKNHRMLLECFAAGPARDARCHLVLAGGADRPEELEVAAGLRETARRLGVESAVHFLGERQDTPELYAASDVFVLASHSEANPLSVMEAMAAGLPVLATNVGGLPELVADGTSGVLAPRGDSIQMTAMMMVLMESAELRRRMGEASAAIAAERFDVSRMVDSYSMLYERVSAT